MKINRKLIKRITNRSLLLFDGNNGNEDRLVFLLFSLFIQRSLMVILDEQCSAKRQKWPVIVIKNNQFHRFTFASTSIFSYFFYDYRKRLFRELWKQINDLKTFQFFFFIPLKQVQWILLTLWWSVSRVHGLCLQNS